MQCLRLQQVTSPQHTKRLHVWKLWTFAPDFAGNESDNESSDDSDLETQEPGCGQGKSWDNLVRVLES